MLSRAVKQQDTTAHYCRHGCSLRLSVGFASFTSWLWPLITHHVPSIQYCASSEPELWPPLETPIPSNLVMIASCNQHLSCSPSLFMSWLKCVPLATPTPQKSCQCLSPSPPAQTHCSQRNITMMGEVGGGGDRRLATLCLCQKDQKCNFRWGLWIMQYQSTLRLRSNTWAISNAYIMGFSKKSEH